MLAVLGFCHFDLLVNFASLNQPHCLGGEGGRGGYRSSSQFTLFENSEVKKRPPHFGHTLLHVRQYTSGKDFGFAVSRVIPGGDKSDGTARARETARGSAYSGTFAAGVTSSFPSRSSATSQ